MKCQNRFCIYQKCNKCTLEKIEIDERGICKCKQPADSDVIKETLVGKKEKTKKEIQSKK